MTPATRQLHDLLRQTVGPDKAPTDPVLHIKVRNLINAGADLSAVDGDGFTPLLRCLAVKDPVSHGSLPLCLNSVLVATTKQIVGADSSIDFSAITYGTAAEITRNWRQLAAAFATPQLQGFLQADTGFRNLHQITALIDAGADVNARDADGFTPLHRCLGWTYDFATLPEDAAALHDILDALLAAGADIDATTPDNLKPPDLATLWQDQQLAQKKLGREAYRRSDPVLMQRVKRIDTWWPKPGQPPSAELTATFMTAFLVGSDDMVAYMLHVYPEGVHWRDANGQTVLSALTLALTSDQIIPRLEKLIAAGADVNAQDNEGNTALIWAVRHGAAMRETIALLIAHGANERMRATSGLSAIGWADVKGGEVVSCLQNAIDARARLHLSQEEQRQYNRGIHHRRLAALARQSKLKLKPGPKP